VPPPEVPAPVFQYLLQQVDAVGEPAALLRAADYWGSAWTLTGGAAPPERDRLAALERQLNRFRE